MLIARLSIALLAVLVIAAFAQAAEDTATADSLVAFTMLDQFDATHTAQDLSGRVALVMWADRKGSDHRPRWERILERKLARELANDQVTIPLVAHLEGVPGFVKGRVMKRFREDDTPILLDWDGAFAASYAPTEDHLNLLVFDADSRLAYQTAVTKLDQEALDQLLAAVRAAVDAGPPGPPVMLD